MERDNYLNLQELRYALSTGSAKGTVGHLNLATIDLEKLDDALMNSKRRRCTTELASIALETAEMIRGVRAALKFLDWGSLRDVLNDWDDQEWQSKWQENSEALLAPSSSTS